ncbi:MAG: hypothetical protein GF329_10680 [Candidatus Lokiarchaeota archaeon]|nr:hypothetical protein [Candidatus Lokiarchaeota archaeon]
MKVVTFDIGVGTIDILVWDSEKVNIFKMVMPSPLQFISKRIKSINDRDLLINGIEMGGYPIGSAIISHLSKNLKVYMTYPAWKTIKYNRKYVLDKGIQIVDEKKANKLNEKPNIEVEFLTDLNIDYYFELFTHFGIETDFDYIGIAVQDHGYSADKKSSTNFRREWIVNLLKNKPKFSNFLFSHKSIPDYLSRSKGLANYIYEKTGIPLFIADTVIVAMKGCLYDPNISHKRLITMDIGNGHTCAFSIDSEEILGYFEFHTHSITPEKLEWALNSLVNGDLTNEDILKLDGHGAYIRKKMDNDYKIIVTGPRRDIMENVKLEYVFGAPFGDHMITGAVGLLKLILERIK